MSYKDNAKEEIGRKYGTTLIILNCGDKKESWNPRLHSVKSFPVLEVVTNPEHLLKHLADRFSRVEGAVYFSKGNR